MNAPDKIYLHPDIGGREFIRPWLHRAANSESVAYIRKDALLEWANNMKRICKGAEPIEKAYQTMIEKIESL